MGSEEKAEKLAEVLGYDCDEIYVLALLFEELDNFIPFLVVITNILWWLVDICESYVLKADGIKLLISNSYCNVMFFLDIKYV